MTANPEPSAAHDLTVQQADALWDAVAVPGPEQPTFPAQHERVCRAVAAILSELPAVVSSPPATDRATVLREAADALPEADLPFVPPMDRRRVADWLRRMADEAQQAAAGARQPDTEPHPPHDSWLVEWRAEGGDWAVAYPTHDRSKALDRLARGRQEAPDWQWRLVRETTSYSVEQPAGGAGGVADETGQAPPVGYSGKGRVWCLSCPRPDGEDVPVGVDLLAPYEECAGCRQDVAEVARAREEKRRG